jgi:hypothetical protein
VRVPPAPPPVRRVDPAELREAAAAPALRAFWIGHASVYVEIDGVRLLVDPIFSEYASPFNVGPRRFHPPPIGLDELPPIDAVLITHDHYDHLDMRSVRRLAGRGSRFFVPLGIGAHLERWGVPAAQIVEFEWWQEQRHRGVRFVSTPTRHYSGRRLFPVHWGTFNLAFHDWSEPIRRILAAARTTGAEGRPAVRLDGLVGGRPLSLSAASARVRRSWSRLR